MYLKTNISYRISLITSFCPSGLPWFTELISILIPTLSPLVHSITLFLNRLIDNLRSLNKQLNSDRIPSPFFFSEAYFGIYFNHKLNYYDRVTKVWSSQETSLISTGACAPCSAVHGCISVLSAPYTFTDPSFNQFNYFDSIRVITAVQT